MQQRRRLTAQSPTTLLAANPVLAILLVVALIVTAVFGGNQILKTQTNQGNIQVKQQTAKLADGETKAVDDPAVATQGGEDDEARYVKEFQAEEPFSMFALTWHGPAEVPTFVRAQREDGSWSQWFDTEPLNMAGTDGKTGTELLYIEPTTRIQINVAGLDVRDSASQAGSVQNYTPEAPEEEAAADLEVVSPGAAVLPSNYGAIRPVTDETDASQFEYAPVTVDDIEVVMIDGGSGLAKGITNVTDSASTVGMPKVITRAEWGADESWRGGRAPKYTEPVKGVIVHHTAGSNNYSEKAAPGIMRGIYQYHALTLGWHDVGYAALVDKYGNVYEGRAGGLDRGVQGAHVGGFNENTWGISIMGNYMLTKPSDISIQRVGELAGWKAHQAGFDPLGSTYLSASFNFTGSKFAKGQGKNFPNISAHRDFHYNLCPGDHVYARMDDIRTIAQQRYSDIKAGKFSNAGTSASSSTAATSSAQAAGLTQTTTVTSTPKAAQNLKPGETYETVGADGTTTRYMRRNADGSLPTSGTTTTAEPTDSTTTSAKASTTTATATATAAATATATVTETEKATSEPSELEKTIKAALNGDRDAAVRLVASAAIVLVKSFLNGETLSLDSLKSTGLAAISTDPAIAAKANEIANSAGSVLGEPVGVGGPSGGLGPDLSDEVLNGAFTDALKALTDKDAPTVGLFTDGLIVDSEETGTRALWGTIADAWIKEGMDLGKLGLPINDQHVLEDGQKLRVDFEGGAIEYDPAENVLNIITN